MFKKKNEENKEKKKDIVKIILYLKLIIFNIWYNIYSYKPKKIKISNLRCTIYCSETYYENCKTKYKVFF